MVYAMQPLSYTNAYPYGRYYGVDSNQQSQNQSYWPTQTTNAYPPHASTYSATPYYQNAYPYYPSYYPGTGQLTQSSPPQGLPKPAPGTPPKAKKETPEEPKLDTAIFEEMGIHPEDITVSAPDDLFQRIDENKADLLHEILTLHKEAQADHKQYPNISNYHFLSKVILSNGLTIRAGNQEAARDLTVSSDYLATMKALDYASPSNNKILILYLTDSRKSLPPLNPSEELREWMALAGNPKYASPFMLNTMVVTLERCPDTGNHTLRVRRVKDMITTNPSASSSSKWLWRLPLEVSPQATTLMEKKKIKEKQLRRLMKKAKTAYNKRKKLFPDESIESAAVQLGKHVYTATNTKWSPRIVERPGVTAASYGIHDREQQMKTSWLRRLFFGKPTSPEIDAIAYYGDDPRYPLPTTMSKISRHNNGNSDTLVLTIQNDALHVSTIKEHKSIPEKV